MMASITSMAAMFGKRVAYSRLQEELPM